MVSNLKNLLAQGATTNPIGKIEISNFPFPTIDQATGELTGLIAFGNTLLRLLFIAGGVWGLLNIVLAGFGFLSAGGDPKNITKAWSKMWQSLIGLMIIVSSFALAAIVGIVVFKDPSAILVPKLTR